MQKKIDKLVLSFEFFLTFFIVVQTQFSAFPPTPLHHHPLFPPHLVIVHVSFIVVPENPSPFSCYPLSLNPMKALGHSNADHVESWQHEKLQTVQETLPELSK